MEEGRKFRRSLFCQGSVIITDHVAQGFIKADVKGPRMETAQPFCTSCSTACLSLFNWHPLSLVFQLCITVQSLAPSAQYPSHRYWGWLSDLLKPSLLQAELAPFPQPLFTGPLLMSLTISVALCWTQSMCLCSAEGLKTECSV